MKDTALKYHKYDWEGISFPLKLTQIESISNHYVIPFDSELTIWRDDDYRLIGLIEGVVKDIDDLEYRENKVIKKAGFIHGETLRAKSDNFDFLIKGFGINSINSFHIQDNKGLMNAFKCDIYIENLNRLNKSDSKPNIISELYLCSMPKVLFANRTSRYDEHPRYKIRNGIDFPVENESKYFRTGHSSSWDFAVVKHKDYEIIIQTVEKKYLPSKTDGVAIEYRNTKGKFPSKEFRKMFQEYISFIIGSHIQKIGVSKYELGYGLLSYKSQNPWKRRIKKNGNLNPIPLINENDREFFEEMLNKLFDNFKALYEKISLSDCLWKLWIGSDLPIGTNLPIIASGFEILVDSYLKDNNLLKKYTKKEKLGYSNLIKEDIESLSEKLAPYDFGTFVLNKLKNPYNYGIGEKMSIFFESISIEFEKDSLENKALKARNLMTHQCLDTDTEEKQRNIKMISDAYITLVNRVILKLLGYDWYYIDYSKEGIRYLKMNQNL